MIFHQHMGYLEACIKVTKCHHDLHHFPPPPFHSSENESYYTLNILRCRIKWHSSGNYVLHYRLPGEYNFTFTGIFQHSFSIVHICVIIQLLQYLLKNSLSFTFAYYNDKNISKKCDVQAYWVNGYWTKYLVIAKDAANWPLLLYIICVKSLHACRRKLLIPWCHDQHRSLHAKKNCSLSKISLSVNSNRLHSQ